VRNALKVADVGDWVHTAATIYGVVGVRHPEALPRLAGAVLVKATAEFPRSELHRSAGRDPRQPHLARPNGTSRAVERSDTRGRT
jgi:hypothetical protein